MVAVLPVAGGGCCGPLEFYDHKFIHHFSYSQHLLIWQLLNHACKKTPRGRTQLPYNKEHFFRELRVAHHVGSCDDENNITLPRGSGRAGAVGIDCVRSDKRRRDKSPFWKRSSW